MARIRSTHPGQWSDEDFVALSFPARLLALAVRNIADDRGIFEWKPLTLKMQLFPADSIEIASLLSELEENNIVMKFAAGGKHYGATRNFMKWQRPKKPSYVHPIAEPILEYVGCNEARPGTNEASDDPSSEPVPNQFPTGTEITPQRKEEGGRRKKDTVGFAIAQSTAVDLSKPKPEPEPQPAQIIIDGNGSDEDRFWSLASALEAKGVGRSMLGKLANLLDGDFTTGVGALQNALAAKSARPYLAKITRSLEQSNTPPAPPDPNVPAWVTEARTVYGYPVDREGKYWRMAGALFDDAKIQVGN